MTESKSFCKVLEEFVEQMSKFCCEWRIAVDKILEELSIFLQEFQTVFASCSGCSLSLGEQFETWDTRADLFFEVLDCFGKEEVILGAMFDGVVI